MLQKCDRRVMESGTAELGIIESLLQANGKEIWLETNKIPLRGSEGNVIGVYELFGLLEQHLEITWQYTPEFQQNSERLEMLLPPVRYLKILLELSQEGRLKKLIQATEAIRQKSDRYPDRMLIES